MMLGLIKDIQVANLYSPTKSMFGLNLVYSWQNMRKDWSEQKSDV